MRRTTHASMTTTTEQRKLAPATDCEIRYDTLTRQLYATDASIYQAEPYAVALPRSPEQTAQVIRAAVAEDVPVIPRGAGTGLAGSPNHTQCSWPPVVVVNLSDAIFHGPRNAVQPSTGPSGRAKSSTIVAACDTPQARAKRKQPLLVARTTVRERRFMAQPPVSTQSKRKRRRTAGTDVAPGLQPP